MIEKVHDEALTCRKDLFDKLVDYAEPRHKDWNKVFANVLRSLDRHIMEMEERQKRMESRGLL